MRNLLLIGGALLLLPVAAQAKTLDELLVEKGVMAKGSHMDSRGHSAKVYYSGGTRFEFPDKGFTSKIGVQLQPRYEFTDNDDGTDNTSSFRLRRARLKISGTALNKEFEYYFQTDMVGDTGEDGSAREPEFLDGFVKWNACDWVYIKAGQYKTPVSRQFVNSSTKLQFADRSLASETFDKGRQQGASIGGDWEGISWAAMITNGSSTGEGRNRPGVDTDHGGYVNARYSGGDINPYEEGDVHGTEDLAWSAGATYGFSSNETGAVDADDEQSVNVDFSAKYQGWSFHAEYYFERDESGAAGASDIDTQGFYAQAGYFITPGELELAGRYSYVDYDTLDPVNDSDDEVSVSLNYYWWAHQIKAQVGAVFETDEDRDGTEIDTSRWLIQLSTWF